MADEAATGSAEWGAVPFKEAIDYFRQKVNVPSAKWADILAGSHARAFTVAGATKEGMLVDFRASLDKALADGTTIEDFRKDFDGIVQRYGWDYNGGRNWRTNVIYQTNLTTAYAAGRYAQMTDPDLLRVRPYWKYVHADGEDHPRPEHLAWNGLVLKHDDPFWSTHYPPNGWGCRCTIETLSEAGLKQHGKSAPDHAPPIDLQPATLNTSAGPIEIQTPKGVDPGWGYSVGEANQGKKLADDVMEAYRKQGPAAWDRLTPNDPPPSPRLPVDPPIAAKGPRPTDVAGLEAAIASAIGGPEAAILTPTGDTVLVNAASLADHMEKQPSRGDIAPFIFEMLTDPAEIWMAFERHKGTGLVVLRQRFLKLVDLKRPGLFMVASASRGRLEAWTMFNADPSYMAKQRLGKLIYVRK